MTSRPHHILFGCLEELNGWASRTNGRGASRILVGKPEGKRPLRRHRGRWEEYIKTDLPELGRGT